MSGKVIVRVNKRVKGDHVRLFVAGKEKVFTRQNGSRLSNERFLMQAAVDLSDMSNKQVKRGTYSFPFIIALPPSLPSTMSQIN